MVRSGTRLLYSTATVAWRAATSVAQRATSGFCAINIVRSAAGGIGMRVSRVPLTPANVGDLLPQEAARRVRAASEALWARAACNRAVATGTLALVASTGETLPALTRSVTVVRTRSARRTTSVAR